MLNSILMNKSLLAFSITILTLISCQKEEVIKHDSPIFLNNNASFIGTWEYLYTESGGGYLNLQRRSDQDLPDIKINPYGSYEMFKGSTLISKGVIDTIKTIQNILYVKFYPNGILISADKSPALKIQNADTLLILTSSGDTYRSEHFKRK